MISERFIDRQRELAVLEDAFRRPDAQLIVVSGRRRIGKTALTKAVARRDDVILVQGLEAYK